jgi:hypothetical protein
MTTLDRAKAAIASQLGVSGAPIESFALSDGRMISTESLARAILAGIREPSEAVMDAGGADDDLRMEDAANRWRAMIDAALNE